MSAKPKLSDEKVASLLDKLKSNPNLAGKLGLLEKDPPLPPKRSADGALSPLRTKKVKLPTPLNVLSSGTPDETAQGETSTSGARNLDPESTLGTQVTGRTY